MKKSLSWFCLVIAVLFVGCAEKVTGVTVGAAFQELLTEYTLDTVAKEIIENEDGSITYSIPDSTIIDLKEKASENLSVSVDEFIGLLTGIDSEVVAEIAFNEDGTILEANVSDASGAQTGLIFLVVPAYPDIVALQLLSGITPTGITFKITDADTGELFENSIPF